MELAKLRQAARDLTHGLSARLGADNVREILDAIDDNRPKDAFDIVETAYDSVPEDTPDYDAFNDLMGILDDIAIYVSDNQSTH